MEQKAKKFDELNKYERAMATATLENKLENMAKELQQIALALGISVHVEATFFRWEKEPGTSGQIVFIGDEVVRRELRADGDLFGIIEEALSKEQTATE